MSKRKRSRTRRRVTPTTARAARRALDQVVDRTYHQVVPSSAPMPSAEDRMSQPQREQARRAKAAVRRAEQQRRRRVRHTLACRGLPHTVTVLTAAAGVAAWGLAALVAWMALPTWPVAVVAGAGTLAAVGGAHYAARAVITAEWRWRTWTAGIVCVLWVAGAALIGVSWPMLAGLLLAEIALAAGWWRRHPLEIGPGKAAPTAEAVAAPEPETVDDAEVVQVLQDWAEHVACDGGPVPGSRLTNPHTTKFKVEFVLELVRGKQSLAKVLARLDEIATGLGYHREKLLFERIRLSEEDEEQRTDEAWKVKFSVVLRSPIARARFFTAPVVRDDGSVEVGSYADGDGRAAWPFWNKAGMRNGAVIGGTRSGKGGVSGVLAVSARATTVLNLLYVDPQSGMSGPEIAARATVAILGKNSVRRAIAVVEALADGREEYGSTHNRSKFMPKPEMPGWVVLLDEAHTTFKGRGTAWMEFFSRCLKFGMCGIAFTQYAGLTAFDGSEHLRSSVAMNYIALKTQSATSGGLIPGLSRDPVTLPDGKPGYGIFGGTVRSDVPFRGDFLPTGDDELDVEPPLRLGPALDAYPEPAVCEVDRRSLIRVLGPPNQDGRWVLSDRNRRGASTAVRAAAAGTASYFTALRPLSLVTDANPGTGTVPASAGSTPPAAAQLTEYERGVLAAMADGHHRVRDIRQSCGWSRSLVHDVLSELKRKKVVHQPKYGTWLPGDGPNYDGPNRRKTA